MNSASSTSGYKMLFHQHTKKKFLMIHVMSHVPRFKIFTILFWKSWVDLPNSVVTYIANVTNIDSFRWKSCKTRDFVLNLHWGCSEFMWFNALERCWYVLCYQLLHWHFVICRCGFQLMHENWSPPRFVNFALFQMCLQGFNMSECHLFNEKKTV